MSATPPYTLITGASSGLGKAFAELFAQQSKPLILIALQDSGLKMLAEKLRQTYNTVVIYFTTDLTDATSLRLLVEQELLHRPIDTLINNAGTGGSKAMEHVQWPYIENILRLNITALTFLTYSLLDQLKLQPHAWILNVSSMTCFHPTGFKTVYPASKAFVYTFSVGLREELKNSNVSVSVITPGPMMTNPEVTRRTKKQGWFARIACLSPEKTAQVGLKKMYARKAVITPGLGNKFFHLLSVLLPGAIRVPFLTNRVKVEISQFTNTK
ncbi:SDR family NAD(P)-dependent oxidoreductase [Persicobacter psychrovividus]|uniref:Short-chain dehydrogenase n=1 Tax=Persicobacter psychrovividus TaxID=387638 RepID=A0ABM7VAC2_9BACT|nr:short-chain dehydrogenase [Persicobacter psychrovividus]